MPPIPRLQPHSGWPILSYGFRPFYLLGSLYAGGAILAWMLMLTGALELSSTFTPQDWHVHEMLYGFLVAIVTGFLLTAVPNWTGNLPLQGRTLLVLVVIWLFGRIVTACSAHTGWLFALLADNAFLLLLTLAIGREIFAGRNWRNLKVLIAVGVLLAGNVTFHLEAQMQGSADHGWRIGIAAVLALVMLIGGRVIPSFTRNWLARAQPGTMPIAFNRFDIASLIVAVAALVLWVAAPSAAVTGAALVVAGLVQALRLARWAGHRTWPDRLVAILHLSYLFVPVGFLLLGLAAFGRVGESAGVHAWTAGAMSTLILAMMTRSSLGHTGRPLRATTATQALYALVILGAVLRVLAALGWGGIPMLHAAATIWASAFIGFAVVYWRILTGPRLAK
ncbi:NnrS family protein [Terrihabitans sp. B22-R8]|uniref:NnrS family protein n=1 Tax=Terrihabitans sp. B22-R8 TaxID=3425128 RepID=UPI00403D0808